MQSWGEFETFLNALIFTRMADHTSSTDVWTCDWKHVHHHEALVEAVKAAEREHLPMIEAAISVIAESGQVDLLGLEPESLVWLQRRVETVAWFIHQFTVNGVSVVPFPALASVALTKWALHDWWVEHGYEAYADSLIASQWESPE